MYQKQNDLKGFTWELAKEYEDILSLTTPYYNDLISLVTGFVNKYAEEDKNATIYDLGASPGRLMRSVLSAYPEVTYYAVDYYQPMIDLLNKELSSLRQLTKIPHAHVQTWDLNNLDRGVGNSFVSVIFANYVLSYLNPTSRLPILKNCYQELKSGGSLVICDVMGLESIKNMKPTETLQPQTLAQTIELLKQVGFSKIDVFFKWMGFEGIVAEK